MSIKDKYKVRSIDTAQCKEWLLYKHYARRMCPIEYSFGLFDEANILQGIVTYGTPVSAPLKALFGDFKLMELNRLCVSDELPKNALSYLVSQSLQMLPTPLVIVSYADTSQNHHGYIYQATNFTYTGLSAIRTDVTIQGFEGMHSASIMDKSRGKENRMQYLREVYGNKLTLEPRPRKHRYFYFLGSKKQKKAMLKALPYPIEPYPKGDNKRYDSSYQISIQTTLF